MEGMRWLKGESAPLRLASKGALSQVRERLGCKVMQALASAPTLRRLGTLAIRAQCATLHEVLLDQFIASDEQPPAGLVLDIDALDIPVHEQRELREFLG